MVERRRPTTRARGVHAAWRRFSSRPGPAVVGALTIGLGTGVGLPLLHTGLATSLAESDAGPGWSPGWTMEMVSPTALLQAGADVLLVILVGLTLTYVGVTVLNLLVLELSRSIDRRHEAAIRTAVGATRGRLRIQRLGEVLLRTIPGLLLAGGIATVGWSILAATRPEVLPVTPGGRPLLMAMGLAVGLPLAARALAATRLGIRRGTPPRKALGAGSRATADRGEILVRSLLGGVTVGGVLVLLVSAGLLLRAAPEGIAGEDPSDAPAILTYRIDSPDDEPDTTAARFADLHDTLATVPGVASSAVASPGALLDLGAEDRVRTACEECVRGGMWTPVIEGRARLHAVSPGFFDTVGAVVRRGREFGGDDVHGGLPVAVVNRSAGNRLYSRGDPLGKPIRIGGDAGTWYTVVGIVDDLPAAGLAAGGERISSVYLASPQHRLDAAHLAVRTDHTADADTVRQVERVLMQAGFVALPLGTLEGLRREAERPVRWLSALLLALGLTAAALATLGLHTLVRAQLLARRQELALRVAVGATPMRTLAWITGWMARSLLPGAVIGFLASVSIARVLQLFVPGLRPLDPLVYGAAIFLVALSLLLGMLGPALRAGQSRPGKALREG